MLSDCGFWRDFLANFLSDLLAGVLLGTFLALWVGRQLSTSERSQQRKEERKAELEKALRYLELLKQEIKDLIDRLPGLINAFQETGWGREVQMPTPYWDVLQPSGELPKLLDAQLLASLTQFYDPLAYAKRGMDLVKDGWLVSQPSSVPGMNEKLKAFTDMTLFGLKQALYYGRNLPYKLEEEIQALRTQLETL